MEANALTESQRETLAAFGVSGPSGAPMTTQEVADHLDVSRRSAYGRLERMVDRGLLESKKVGSAGRVWWRPPETAGTDGSGRSMDASCAESLVTDVLERADVGVFVLDSDLEVAWVNEATERYFGLDRASVLGREKRSLVVETIAPAVEDTTGFAEAVVASYDDDASVEEFECRVTPGEGREARWLQHRSEPIDSGTFAGGRVELYYDVTDRKRSERARRQDRDVFESLVEAVEEYAIFRLHPDGRVRTWNAGAERIMGYDAADIVGEHVSTFYTEESREEGVPEQNLAAAAANGSIEDEGWRLRSDGTRFWAHVTVTAIRDDDGELDGFAKVTRDMTDQREYERRLERQAARLQRQRDDVKRELDEVFDRIQDGFFALDDELRFTYVNEHAEDVLEISESDVLGAAIWDVLEPGPLASEAFDATLESQEPTSFEEYYEPLETWFENRVYPSESGLSVYFRDVTERKERERELEESRRWTRTLVENFPAGAVALVDENLRYVTFAGTPEGDTDLRRTDLEGELVRDVLPESVADVVVPRYEAALEGEASEFEDTIDDRVYQFHFVPVRDDDGEVFGVMGMSQDVTERTKYERELRDAKSQLEAATQAGAIGTFEWHVQEDEMVVGPSFAKQFAIDPDVAREGVSLDRFVSSIHEDDRDRVERQVEAAVESCGEYESEYRVRNANGELRWVVARGHVECDEDGNPVTFPGALTDITEQKRAERALEQQREQLVALNNLNEVVQEITESVIDQSTREEVEATVVERLAGTDSYMFAWIGEVDVASQTVECRAEAGVDGYLDEITISVDPDDERSQGPTGRAVQTGDVQTTQDIRADGRHDPWREHVEEYGFRSSAAIPIAHEGTLYGVLNVYAERPKAFEGRERAVVAQLGEVVGHAIAAAERKRALMSDEVVELEFHVPDLAATVGLDDPLDGRIGLNQAIPLSDNEYLAYGTATRDAVPALEALTSALPQWEDVSVDADGEEVAFELRLDDPPVLSALASIGGSIDDFVVADGDLHMRLHVPPGSETRPLLEVIQETFPDVELQRRRQVESRDGGVQRELLERLTDRQRVAVEAAYHAGFFEWPRDTSGEEVASSLDVSSPTFHQHLRKAEKKLFDSLLETAG